MILRKRFKNGYQVNHWIGKQYHLADKEGCPEEFACAAREEFGENWQTNDLVKDCYAFVIYNFIGPHKNEVSPLYNGQRTWIISPCGQIIDDLTHR